MKKIILILLVVVFLTGCVTSKYWYKDGRMVDGFTAKAETDECKREPDVMERKDWREFTEGILFLTAFVPGVNIVALLTHWQAVLSHEKSIDRCMAEKGYTFKRTL